MHEIMDCEGGELGYICQEIGLGTEADECTVHNHCLL